MRNVPTGDNQAFLSEDECREILRAMDPRSVVVLAQRVPFYPWGLYVEVNSNEIANWLLTDLLNHGLIKRRPYSEYYDLNDGPLLDVVTMAIRTLLAVGIAHADELSSYFGKEIPLPAHL